MPLYELAGTQPTMGERSWVAPSADLIGDVHLGDHASVWFGAVIRADNTPIVVGADSNVQEGAVLHSDPGQPLVVGRGCTIGHQAMLHGCTIGDHVLVGIKAVVLNGAIVGDDCLIGAGALVTEGKSFPAGQLILGTPAKVARPLTPEEIARLRVSAAGYVAKAGEMAAGLHDVSDQPAG